MTNRISNTIIPVAVFVMTAFSVSAERILHVPMEPVSRDFIRETTGNKNLLLNSRFAPESPEGAVGGSLRFDGFSSYVQGNVNAGSSEATSLTFSMWVAPETYPVIALDTPTDSKITLAGTYDESSKTGWRFGLGYTGKYIFECYSAGWKVTVEASDILPTYEWSNLVAVCDGTNKKITLYRNGVQVGQRNSMGSVDNSATRLMIGKSSETSMTGPFFLNTFNGLIDEIEVFDVLKSEEEIRAIKPQHPADLSIPSSRYSDQALRPRFHGMPATAWTNECHGMTYSNGRYHLFFQKNANGPYMTRLHWGHISSSNLLDWREEKIAIAPGEPYDIKGCWSGTIFTDPELTGNRPGAIYTAVDYSKASICMAVPDDDDLIRWNKNGSNPLINGRPSGLTDDFRDPYFFRNGNDAYLIVGSSANGLGVTTLHKYNQSTKSFSNDGRIFFSATNAGQQGTFWEMPNITKMAEDKWLFTVTPLGTSDGVKCLYWVGEINPDGTFKAVTGPKSVEMNSRDGYGLLSPTVYQHEGKTIALGIVPDKLSGEDNYALGWAHCYSLPREWSLDSQNNLLQKPWSGVAAMRMGAGFEAGEGELTGEMNLDGISGRQVEIKTTFTVGSSSLGIRIFEDGKIYYNQASGELIADFTNINRLHNDAGSYNGIYRMPLPERPSIGTDMTIDLFMDGSIIDIFVNDKYAQSIRLFAHDGAVEEYSVYSEGTSYLKSLKAWNLDVQRAGIGNIFDNSVNPAYENIYDMQGRLVNRDKKALNVTEGLDSGIYIVNGKKVLVK